MRAMTLKNGFSIKIRPCLIIGRMTNGELNIRASVLIELNKFYSGEEY